ncbi:carboxypeptidase-like regulatory domain-containing protein [Planctomicrobium sp. SH668]|uniref:carboxypeptidase-like regulatory domain-containing protein n=1 Tax=Planctomicrobium sp. SH668 TaxID=3448126 RepID=UPI003F5C0453
MSAKGFVMNGVDDCDSAEPSTRLAFCVERLMHQFGLLLMSLFCGCFGLELLSDQLQAGPPRLRNQQRPAENIADVSLNADAVLAGAFVDPAGGAVKDAQVILTQNRKVIWSGRTNNEGLFEASGIATGVYRVDCGKSSLNCRVWTPESAPPKASGVLILTRNIATGTEQRFGNEEDWSLRFSGFHTLAFPRLPFREVRKPVQP